MLKNLVKLRLRAIIAGMGQAVRGKSRGLQIGFALLMVYAFGACALSMGMMFYALCQPLHMLGLDWLYFALMGAVSMLLCLIVSILVCKNQLYSARDNELLLAMPIKPIEILAARVISITVLNWLYCLVTAVPMLVAWFIAVGFQWAVLIRFIPLFLALPLLAEALGCLFGWLISLAEKRLPNKNLFTTLFTLAFLACYFAVMSKADSYMAYLLTNSKGVADALKAVFPVYSFGMALSGDLVQLVLFAALSAAAIGAAAWLLSNGFTAIALSPAAVKCKRHKAAGFTRHSPGAALVIKELRYFSSSSVYMLNAGLGLLMMPMASAALAVKREALTGLAAALPAGMQLPLEAILAALLAGLASTVFISAPSISLEGKTLYLIRSLPLSSGDILLSKARCHWLLCLPVCTVSALICGISLGARAAMWPALLLLPALQSALCGLMGVAINLHFPKFDWTNQVQVIKQGAGTTLAMLLGMASVITPVALYLTVLADHISADLAVYLWAVLLAAACLLLRRYLTHGGARRFEALAG